MSNAGWDKSSVRALERRSAPGIGAKIPQAAQRVRGERE